MPQADVEVRFQPEKTLIVQENPHISGAQSIAPTITKRLDRW
jgi:hypothetical protein